MIIDITEKNKSEFNKLINHPLQSYEWGVFKEKTNVKVIRKGILKNGKMVDAFQLMIHSIPHFSWKIGYLPKGNMPTKEVLEELMKIGREEKCIFIQLEPNVPKVNWKLEIGNWKFPLERAVHPLFTKYSFQLDLTKTEDELFKQLHPKTRYNIRVAQKNKVIVKEETNIEAFNTYWQLTQETTKRQKFLAHTKRYHELMWETLHSPVILSEHSESKDLSQKNSSVKKDSSTSFHFARNDNNKLFAHLFVAYYTADKDTKPIPLSAWILFVFQDTLYYPYGASSAQYRNVMANNLMMWEAIKFGKKLGLKKFDMWGALGPNPDKNHPWYGFHKFKEGYGGDLVEFVGSYDLVINPLLYEGYKIADKFRLLLLQVLKK